MIERGPLTWTDLPILREPPYIGGRQMAGSGTEWAATPPAQPAGIPTGAGTTLRQRAPGNRLAPAFFRQTFDFSGRAVESDDWRHLLAVEAAGDPVDWFTEWPTVDVWRIRLDDTVRTHWQLSRPIPRDLFSAAQYPVRAFVEDRQGTLTPTAAEQLTEISSGSPGAGEILIPADERVLEVVTADLAPEGPWRQLRLEFNPLYIVTLDAFDKSEARPGDLRFRMSLGEHLPPRTYRATA